MRWRADDNGYTFFGLTQVQVFGLVLVMMLASWAITVYEVYKVQGIAAEGARATAALCVVRESTISERDKNVHFLGLSHKQRVEEFGRLGNIPDPVILKNIADENRRIIQFRALRCQP